MWTHNYELLQFSKTIQGTGGMAEMTRRRGSEGGSSMNSNSPLSYAIAAILSGASAGSAHAAAAASDADASSEGIQEIVVTAQRRTENMQDVPITIQALTAETLTQLSVSTFDDFVKYLPNVTAANNGPGQENIYMRGLSAAGVSGNQGAGAVGPFPNVAIYLDEQSGQAPGRNLDVYAADLERIEVLEGPQGTLFGAGAQAGVLRYITNKPKLDVTEGSVDAGYAYTSHGDPSSNVTGVINLPLIADTLAVRAVIYSDTRGGYINNVPGTFVRSSTDPEHSLRRIHQQHSELHIQAGQRQQRQSRCECDQPADLSGPARFGASTSSTTIGMRCSCSPTRT